MSNLVVLVAPNFGNAELIESDLERLGFSVLKPTVYKESNIDTCLSMIERGDMACYRKNNNNGDYRGISFSQAYKVLNFENTVTTLSLEEFESLSSSYGADVEIFAYFVTDTTENLLKNALSGDIADLDLKSVISMIRTEAYWGSKNAGQFHGVLRHATEERASMLANIIVSDIEHAIHVDSFDD